MELRNYRIRLFISLIIALYISFSFVFKVDAKSAKWNFEVEALLNSATGNSQYKQYVTELRAKMKKGKKSEFNLKFGYNNQRTKGKAFVDRINLEIDVLNRLDGNLFCFGNTSLSRERVRQFRFRSETHAGMGYTNGRKKNNYKIRVGEGIDYRISKNGEEAIFTESIASVEYSHLFPWKQKTKFITKGQIEIRNDTPGKYAVKSEIGITTSMTRNVFVKIGTEIKYDNQVPVGVNKTDTLSGISLIYRF